MPKVSIIVPVYNVEKYLDRCMQSLLNQTSGDIEIILVDDGSPDNCPAMCDDYVRQDSRVKVVHKKNGGLGMACNSGMDVATGEYIAFCDSDDCVEATMYATMYEEAIGSNADLVFTGLRRVGSDGKVLSYLPHPPAKEIHERDSLLALALDMIASEPRERLDRRIQVSAKTVLYRREFLQSNGLRFVSEREYPSEDLIFNVSVVMKANRVSIIPHYFYNYSVNTVSITSTVKPDHFEKMMRTASLLRSCVASCLPNDNDRASGDLNRRVSRFIIGESRSFSRRILASDLPYAEKKELLLNLISNDSFRNTVSGYPLEEMPVIHRIALKLLVSKHFRLLGRLYQPKRCRTSHRQVGVKSPQVLVVATSRKTRGGITSVVRAHATGKQWRQHHCHWVQTHRDGQAWRKMLYFIFGVLDFSVRIPFYDIVHIHVSQPVSVKRKSIFLRMAKALHKKVIVHFHAFNIEDTFDGKDAGRYVAFFDRADKVIVLSNWWKEQIKERLSIPEENIIVLYNPCPVISNDGKS